MTRRTRLALVAACTCLAVGLPTAQGQPAAAPVVFVAELDGIIHPVSAEYLMSVIDRADAAGAELVVFVLRTPGGLLESTRDIVARMIASRAPVVVFVGPAGARAASAGFVLTMAADVAVMAPGTHFGAAHPVSASGERVDETSANKAASDAAAYVRSLAEARGRNVSLASEAVLESRAFTDREALDAKPPLIDFIAPDLGAVLGTLDGRQIRRFDGRTVTVRTAGADIRRVEMTGRQKFLSAIAHPQIAYLLLTLGMLGLVVELWNPGAIAPGVAGGVCLLLAFFAFQILPIDVTGLLLLVLGLALLVGELMVPSFGALGIGGAVALLIGSIMLTDTVPGVRVGYDLVVPVVVAVSAIMLFLGRLGVASQRRKPVTGAGVLVGQTGRARTPIPPDADGQIDIRGEIWRARSRVPIGPGQQVRVLAVDGLTLLVEPAEAQSEGVRP